MIRKKYFLSMRAQTAMNNELRRFPETETGGLLLGYSDTKKGVQILEATDGGYRNVLHEKTAFEYDIPYVEHICTILSELYAPPLDIVGVWHKHNRISAIPFSLADENIHRQLTADMPHPCLSILFEKNERSGELSDSYEMRIFELASSDYFDISGQIIRGKCVYWDHGVCQ